MSLSQYFSIAGIVTFLKYNHQFRKNHNMDAFKFPRNVKLIQPMKKEPVGLQVLLENSQPKVYRLKKIDY